MNEKLKKPQDLESKNLLLFDYERALEMIKHYETLHWQVGAILIAGLFIGLMSFAKWKATLENLDKFPAVIFITLIVVLFWFLWYQRTRVLVLPRFRRLWEIELELEELRQYTYSFEYDAQISESRSVFRCFRHTTLIKLFCIFIPCILIYMYAKAYVQLRGSDLKLLIHLTVFALPIIYILLYKSIQAPREW
jgi:uncharacterized membrane protein YfcA